MSNNANDKYTREGDDTSQVRNIINQLNQDKPSREKSREVVVRPDGTKVVRVTKKRKMMVTNEEKHRRSRKKFFIGLLAFFVVASAIVAFYMYRMSAMCSESYLDDKKQELCAAWGASSVEVMNARVQGMNLLIDKLVATFPDSSILERVELNGLSAPLDMGSFFVNEFRSDNLAIKLANIRLRKGCDKLVMPRWMGDSPIWKIKNVSCAKLNFSIGEPDTSPIVLRNAEAQLYATVGADAGQVLTIGKGTLTIAGVGREPSADLRYDFNVLNAKMFLTSVSVEDISFNCQDPKNSARVEQEERDLLSSSQARELVAPDFVLHGRIDDGGSIYGPYELEIERLPFALLTHGVYDKVFGADVSSSHSENAEHIKMTISPDGSLAAFSGKVMLSDVVFRDADLDAKSVFVSHIVNANQNRKYAKLLFGQAWANLKTDGGSSVLEIREGAMKETGTMDLSVYGRLCVELKSENGQWNDLPLSGELNYSLPRKVLNSEYKGGAIDPVFKADPNDDLRCLLSTVLSGVAIMPKDDSRAQEAATADIRSTLEKAEGFYDVDKLPEILNSGEPSEETSENDIFTKEEDRKESDQDSFGAKDENDIFKTPATTVPVDASIKF